MKKFFSLILMIMIGLSACTFPMSSPTAATEPTAAPTVVLTDAPTAAPTAAPTSQPTVAPTVVPTDAPTAAPTTQPTVEPTAAPTINSVAPEGWTLYLNDVFGYRFYYPVGAAIQETGVMGFPADERPAGETADEYIAELQNMYSDTLCVSVGYGLGYVNFSASANAGSRYVLCGRTGVGMGTMITRTEVVVIDGVSFTATGFEFFGPESPCDVLSCHNETMVLNLPDGTRIEYGALPLEGTYTDYLATTRPVLFQIVGTFAPPP